MRYGSAVIPIRDTIRSRTAPVVTVALIVVNVMVFLHEIALGPPNPLRINSRIQSSVFPHHHVLQPPGGM